MTAREQADGDVGLVQAFVNTVDLLDGPEELTSPEALRAWLAARGLMPAEAPITAADLRHALALREAMRAVIGGTSGLPVYPVDLATLNEAAAQSRLRIRFGRGGAGRLEPEAEGAVGALGRLVAALFAASRSDDWGRLKLCDADDCRWAFYDRSKNHSSRWCTMASCGNREKARRFRQRRAGPSSTPRSRRTAPR